MIDVAEEYIKRRIADLDEMLAVYQYAEQPEPVDLLARRFELVRMSDRLKEYKDVQEADD